MNSKYSILVIAGEPNSIFLEIYFKSLKKLKIKKPLILIVSLKLIKLQMKKFKFKTKIKIINPNKILNYKLDNTTLNIIDVDFKQNKAFEKISSKSNNYIEKCFGVGFKILKKTKIKNLITGPISKKTFLNKKYLGLTEYISNNFKIKKNAMLIYNKKLSVCPLTTHLPLKKVSKSINKKLILEKVRLIDEFYENKFKTKPKIAVLSLNPHGESIDKFNEDEKIVKPTIKYLKKSKYNISGPYSADTFFLPSNMKNFNVVIGMYHDQVLTPIKTLFKYDAINITLGLPFTRVAPDHGPNEKMIGKNTSNPLSLIKAIKFLDSN